MMGGGEKSQSSLSRNNAAGRPYGNKGMRNRGEYGIHCNFFRWADGCEDQVSAAPIPLEVLHELSWRMTSLESDVKTVKMMTMMLLAFVVTFDGMK
ncbi:uncharacterized protein DS421_14g478200 [Arachis hypogaea]|nr:uncharacterized protein DS421_14g478200 [Arachis hypogaea]